MKKPDMTLKNLDRLFPDHFSPEQRAKAKTSFLKELSLSCHRFYHGKMATIPKVGLYGFNWFGVWYTPGVSSVSTTIRDDNNASYDLSNRNNLVAIVTDSTRVLGDGDCSPPGGLGVMEGKAFLMKYLGGVDAVSLCINSYNRQGKHDPERIIDFVKMLEPSFGAVNLEDISQPNCYRVLDTLRQECQIPVWHDDAQGTGSVTLAGLINALRLAEKEISKVRIVLYGAGSSNTTIARLIHQAGGDPENIILFDTHGALHKKRSDVEADPAFYRKWELCRITNPDCIEDIQTALTGADVLIALSRPGPEVIQPKWIATMAPRAIVFACANPVPEIYPYAAKEAGAYIVATGRGDFPNQVNNSMGFPGILKGALSVRARKITDAMAIVSSYSLADFAVQQGISPDYIMPTMEDVEIFAQVAADVAMQAIREDVARIHRERSEVYEQALQDIRETHRLLDLLMRERFIQQPDRSLLEAAWTKAIETVQ